MKRSKQYVKEIEKQRHRSESYQTDATKI